MTIKLKRPEKKNTEEKITEEDMIYFSLGIDRREFVLPSQRKDYRSDVRAVRLIEDIRNGKKISACDFSGINLKGADISGGLFHDCSFKGAIFYKTKAQTCDFTDCCFDEAYMESSDFMGCDFTNASFKKAFSKNNNWDKAFLDKEDLKYLSALEQIIRLIEQGKIDIHSLSKDDLLGLDIRRLDFSKVDLEDLDLSVFALDGINLCGTYIDPKQLMSLEGWNSYCLDLRRTKDITRVRLSRKIMLEKEEDLRQYVDNQKKTIEPIKTKQLKRPVAKKFETEDRRAWGIEKARKEFVQRHLTEKTNKDTMEPAEKYLFEKYLKQYSQAKVENVKTPQNNNINVKEPALGILVTQQNIQMLQSELSSDIPESTFIPSQNQLGKTEQTLSNNNGKQLDKNSTGTNNEIKPQTNEDKKDLPEKTENTPEQIILPKIEPKVIVSHEQTETENLKRTQLLHEENINLEVQHNVSQTQQATERSTLRNKEKEASQFVSQTPYPYFNAPEDEEVIEEVEVVKKSDSDDEETIHDLTSAGYSLEEITKLLRQKGPLKVVGKAPKGRAARHKTKG